MVTHKEPRTHWGMLAEGGLINASMKLLLPPEKVVSVGESWEGRKRGWSDITLLQEIPCGWKRISWPHCKSRTAKEKRNGVRGREHQWVHT